MALNNPEALAFQKCDRTILVEDILGCPIDLGTIAYKYLNKINYTSSPPSPPCTGGLGAVPVFPLSTR